MVYNKQYIPKPQMIYHSKGRHDVSLRLPNGVTYSQMLLPDTLSHKEPLGTYKG